MEAPTQPPKKPVEQTEMDCHELIKRTVETRGAYFLMFSSTCIPIGDVVELRQRL